MRIEIAGRERKPEPTLCIRLEYSLGGVDVMGSNSEDVSWYLCSITPKGTLLRYAGLPSVLGLQLDARGRIIVEDE